MTVRRGRVFKWLKRFLMISTWLPEYAVLSHNPDMKAEIVKASLLLSSKQRKKG
jgi:hypothetical protein